MCSRFGFAQVSPIIANQNLRAPQRRLKSRSHRFAKSVRVAGIGLSVRNSLLSDPSPQSHWCLATTSLTLLRSKIKDAFHKVLFGTLARTAFLPNAVNLVGSAFENDGLVLQPTFEFRGALADF